MNHIISQHTNFAASDHDPPIEHYRILQQERYASSIQVLRSDGRIIQVNATLMYRYVELGVTLQARLLFVVAEIGVFCFRQYTGKYRAHAARAPRHVIRPCTPCPQTATQVPFRVIIMHRTRMC